MPMDPAQDRPGPAAEPPARPPLEAPRVPATRGLWYADDDADFGDFTGATPPRKLLFTLTGKCNLRCEHCPRGWMEVPAQTTPAPLVEWVMAELLPLVRVVRLGGTDLGEQLVAPLFDRFVERVIELDPLRFELVTNLTVMTPERAALLAAGCADLAFSLEGTGAAYERVRGSSWETVERNLALVAEARRRHPGSRLKVTALVTCFRDNLDDLPAILDLCDRGVDAIHFRPLIALIPEQEGQTLERCVERARPVFERIRERAVARGLQFYLPELPAAEGAPAGAPANAPPVAAEPPRLGPDAAPPPPAAAGRWVCHFPFEAVSILSDGTVGTCCEELYLGRLDTAAPGLGRLWRGRDWTKLRRSVAAGRWKGACADCELRRSRERGAR
jgi:MoaA/NifB/PqqE/SkfB family radical SAM enzyme